MQICLHPLQCFSILKRIVKERRLLLLSSQRSIRTKSEEVK